MSLQGAVSLRWQVQTHEMHAIESSKKDRVEELPELSVHRGEWNHDMLSTQHVPGIMP